MSANEAERYFCVVETRATSHEEVEAKYTADEIREVFGHDNRSLVSVLLTEIERLECELTRTEYERHMTALERDALRAENEALQKKAARADYVAKAFVLEDDDAIFEFCMAESVAEFNKSVDAVLATRSPAIDAAIAKEPVQVPAGECPYPIRQDHSIAACVEAGDCGCGEQKP